MSPTPERCQHALTLLVAVHAGEGHERSTLPFARVALAMTRWVLEQHLSAMIVQDSAAAASCL